ncbi:putative nucleotide-diphospho-sugar transferase [Tropicimonas aquimaris]|uniref:Nucleotide-diphospho-sugar transferase n=1 Tax=Tropicimonas aquimaris TaxID=914152 RepID=A0ABW3IJI0_9RHOB
MVDTGFVYAATGEMYVALAVRSARSLREAIPDARIHLFADIDCTDEVFDAVHRLSRSHFRPKFEALRSSPFERSVYLDADTYVSADISDIFDLLQQFDIAGAHVFRRNSRACRRYYRDPLPNSFPQINTGVLGLRRNKRTHAFLEAVEGEMDASDAQFDQAVFRELLFHSDLRLAVLPPEYNFKEPGKAAILSSDDTAPRVIHESRLHGTYDPDVGLLESLEALNGPDLLRHVEALIAADRYLHPAATGKVRPLAISSKPGLFDRFRKHPRG